MMGIFKVVEKFISINGEGTHSGQLAVFVRFAGCNLNCSFCDTTWANEKDVEYTEMTTEDIVSYIEESKVANVTLTGGEPLLQKDICELIGALTAKGYYVEIETNGSVSLKEFTNITPAPSFTMDYKLPGSGMEDKMNRDNFALLSGKDTVKFVAGSRNDLERFKEVVDSYSLTGRCNVYLSPVFGKIDMEDMVNYMIENKMNGVTLQAQLHKIIWEPDKRGV